MIGKTTSDTDDVIASCSKSENKKNTSDISLQSTESLAITDEYSSESDKGSVEQSSSSFDDNLINFVFNMSAEKGTNENTVQNAAFAEYCTSIVNQNENVDFVENENNYTEINDSYDYTYTHSDNDADSIPENDLQYLLDSVPAKKIQILSMLFWIRQKNLQYTMML